MDKLSMAIIAMEAHVACSNDRLRQAWDIIHAKLVEENGSSHNTGSPKLPPDIIEFMAYMVDHCERNIITEEYLCQVGSDYIKWRQLRAGA